MTEKEVSIESIVGYKLDSFQKKSLSIIDKGDDLLVMASTSSGKTTVALIAIILNAFDKGHRAILTTPIKALSNQKYAEFKVWFNKIGYTNRITLLTGDIQARATPEGGDGHPELLIMTSEILANKLDKKDEINPDLVNVSVLIMDEAHYINDTERGHVWERTIMYLPKKIQIVALSATLSEPEKFQEWLSRRRPTQLVQRHDRHVPLHFGFHDSKGFVELYHTHQENKVMDSSIFKKIQPQNGTFSQAITKIVKILEKEEKLPAIIFSMSKKKCEEAANCLSQNLLYGSPPVMKKDDDPLSFGEIQSEHQYTVKTIRNRQDELFQKYLRPYSKLPGFEEFKGLIDKGIAYHHAGMIPILREYVEILFSEKLLKVVFATETLAIGINMPAKTVVFTSLEKPGGLDGEIINLRPEQFMQMSGRAGRRGMDVKGYVVYYPIRNMVSEADFRHLLFGKMPSVLSQLSIDPLFVLKNIANDKKDILDKTLLSHQNQRYINALAGELEIIQSPQNMQDIEKYIDLKERLKPGLIRLSNVQRKAYEKEIKELNLDEITVNKFTKRITIEKEIERLKKTLDEDWDKCLDWLKSYGFIDELELTIKGKIASGLSDGLPLVRATMINETKDITFEEFAGWLGCFTETLRIQDIVVEDQGVNNLLDRISLTCTELKEESSVNYNTGLLIYLWAKNKDIDEICSYIGPNQLGTFIKSVLRVISYIDEIKKILLGLQYYELYNLLDNHQDRLMSELVSNRSLYVEF